MGPRRRALRQATEAAHRALDSKLGPLASRLDYARYLLVMSAFRSVIEREIEHRFSQYPLQPQMLLRDIELDCDDLRLGRAQPITDFELRNCREDYLGTFYVLEGSRLGARVLYSQVQALGLCADFGARHLARQAAEAPRWSAFLSELESAEDIDHEALVEAGRKVFDLVLSIAEAYIDARKR